MMSIRDPNMSDCFTSAMEEIHNKHLKMYSDINDRTAELAQFHRHFVKTAHGKLFLCACVMKQTEGVKYFKYKFNITSSQNKCVLNLIFLLN